MSLFYYAIYSNNQNRNPIVGIMSDSKVNAEIKVNYLYPNAEKIEYRGENELSNNSDTKKLWHEEKKYSTEDKKGVSE